MCTEFTPEQKYCRAGFQYCTCIILQFTLKITPSLTFVEEHLLLNTQECQLIDHPQFTILVLYTVFFFAAYCEKVFFKFSTHPVLFEPWNCNTNRKSVADTVTETTNTIAIGYFIGAAGFVAVQNTQGNLDEKHQLGETGLQKLYARHQITTNKNPSGGNVNDLNAHKEIW